METYFSKNADILLKQRHLTQKEFCNQLGKSKSNWENIVKTNNIEMLFQISKILDMPVEDLIGLNVQKFKISGFIKVDRMTFEIESKSDIEAVLNKISELEGKD